MKIRGWARGQTVASNRPYRCKVPLHRIEPYRCSETNAYRCKVPLQRNQPVPLHWIDRTVASNRTVPLQGTVASNRTVPLQGTVAANQTRTVASNRTVPLQGTVAANWTVPLHRIERVPLQGTIAANLLRTLQLKFDSYLRLFFLNFKFYDILIVIQRHSTPATVPENWACWSRVRMERNRDRGANAAIATEVQKKDPRVRVTQR